jgi:nicotinamidase-related amidase
MLAIHRMSAADTALLVIDVQEKLLAKIPGADRLVQNVGFLIDAARLLDLPVLATEQYAKGLGPTIAPLAARLPQRTDKKAFSCCAVPEVLDALFRGGRPQVVLAGIEAHVCVQQTALDLLSQGFRVFIPGDAVESRAADDRKFALRRLERVGAVVTSAEACVFEWTGTADHPRFKEISRLVQERMAWLGARETAKA